MADGSNKNVLNIPEEYNSLKFISPISWECIFDEWRKGEENQESWRRHWKERGYSSWAEWRNAYVKLLHPEKLEWFLYEIQNPIEALPDFYGVPSQGWIERAYDGEITKKLKDIASLPIISENEKIKEIMHNFSEKTMLTAILHDSKIILVEGMHRANALANWNLPEKPESKVLLAVAKLDRVVVDVLTDGYKK